MPEYMLYQPVPVELFAVYSPPNVPSPGQFEKSDMSKVIGEGESNYVVSGSPCSSAAASVNTLNVDPGWKPLESPCSLGTVKLM